MEGKVLCCIFFILKAIECWDAVLRSKESTHFEKLRVTSKCFLFKNSNSDSQYIHSIVFGSKRNYNVTQTCYQL